ncbi:hypothetical protein SAMN05192555_10166 [Franzmannia pantelleriensis]|uniref:Chain length determinant protein n=1 Tax=Franzmannia pantelleriensis TaxID=48727 RepID=A0A1G9ECT8_9GAMM|nr:hypothetical protein [Halomonas pantelleriensis]SDK73861.1 hypothetical protein SAMN05192555_10166 [Halomonas pantelleriensis]
MTQEPRENAYQDDEISLVDLAKILIQRWLTMAVIFCLVVAGALAYALSLPRPYQYVSLYQAAEQSPTSALESTGALVARANNLYLGPLTREMLAEHEEQTSLPFNVDVDSPSDTLLIRVRSTAETEHAEQVERMHRQLLERMQQDQQAMVERRQETLERRIDSNQQALEALDDSTSPAAGELIATYSQRVAELESELADLQSGEVIQTAVQSTQPSGQSRAMVLALGIVLGGMLALMGAFFAHFGSLVRASLRAERT